MKLKYINTIVFCSFLIIIAGMSALNLGQKLLGIDEQYPEENLATLSFDTVMSGVFIASFEEKYQDHFALRESFISLSKEISALKGFQSVQLIDYAGANVEQTTGTVDDGSDGVMDTKWGQILIYKNAAMEVNTFSEDASKKYATSINNYAEAFPTVNVYSILAPSQIEFIEAPEYREMSISQKKTIQQTNTFFSDDVTPIDVREILAAHSDEYLYFRSDHHWTSLGAYYAFTEFARQIGIKAPELTHYKKQVATNYLGSLYKVTLRKELKDYPDDVEVYESMTPHTYKGLKEKIKYNEGSVLVKKWLDDTDKYAVFLGGDQPIVELSSSIKNGKKILVLKDSYANALVPYFIDIAETVIVIDPRFYDGNVAEIIESYGITDILFVNYALITRWDGYSDLYQKLL